MSREIGTSSGISQFTGHGNYEQDVLSLDMWLPQKHDDAEPEPPRFENPEKVMMVTDHLGRRIPPKKAPEKVFAVLDSSKSTSATDVGAIVSLHRSAQGARKAADKVKHSRVLQLKTNREFHVGEHANGPSDVVWANARWS
jgi:hypothetical protein